MKNNHLCCVNTETLHFPAVVVDSLNALMQTAVSNVQMQLISPHIHIFNVGEKTK